MAITKVWLDEQDAGENECESCREFRNLDHEEPKPTKIKNITYASTLDTYPIVENGDYCSPTCPQLKDGMCLVFSGTLDEIEKAKLTAPGTKLRWEACKNGVALTKKALF